jgi:uncharacterized membrane protein
MTKTANKIKKQKLIHPVHEPEKEYWLSILIVFLTIIAGFLRFYHLDFNSLWLDEISTYTYSTGTFEAMWTMMTTGTDYSPPLFFFLEHFVLEWFGKGELTIRVLPALFGTLTVPAMYYVGKEFWDKNVGVLAAGLVAFSPFLIYYSQDARTYSMALLLVIIGFYFFLKAVKSEEYKDWILFGLFTGLAFWTHFYTLVFTVLVIGYIILKIIPTFLIPTLEKDIKTLKSLAIATSTVILVTLPLIIAFVPLFSQRVSTAPNFGIQGIGIIYATLNQLSGFTDYAALFYLLLFVLGAFIMWQQGNAPGYNGKYPYSSLLLIWIVIGTFIFSIIMSYRMPMVPRHLIFLTIPLSLGIAMVSVGIRDMIPERVQTLKIIVSLLAIFLVLQIPFYLNYYQNYSKEDWKGIAKDLESITIPGDTVVAVPLYIGYPLDYYYSAAQDRTIRKGIMSVEELDPIRQVSNQSVYYIMTGDIYAADPAGLSVTWLRQNATLIRNYGSVWLLKGV